MQLTPVIAMTGGQFMLIVFFIGGGIWGQYQMKQELESGIGARIKWFLIGGVLGMIMMAAISLVFKIFAGSNGSEWDDVPYGK